MNNELIRIKEGVYDPCAFEFSDFKNESESTEYHACRFKINTFHIVCRNAKITPKKIGQFVTFWKRIEKGPIEPFTESDLIDFYIVNVRNKDQFGQFVFPKSILIKKGIISTNKKEGKRAFRVYPIWDIPQNKQAEKTQKWQLNYFYKIEKNINFDKVRELFTPLL
ncbi:MepB family protein [Aquimarina aquimarini]|uniref:MepB family protein n=1 Tax=Aquimarina aquimarini TaxID=1191734 RepID=UPI000D54F2D8|nr:MepB family protein [Aquimarina aquimarini]